MRLFTIDDYVEGRIPAPQNFQQALQEFERGCILPGIQDSNIIGAFPFGSVAAGQPSVASDIDYFVLTKDGSYDTTIKETVTDIAERLWVPIQPHVLPLTLAQTRYHSVDQSFKEHLELQRKRNGHHGKNPLEFLANNGLTMAQALQLCLGRYTKAFIQTRVGAPLGTHYGSHDTDLCINLSIPSHVIRCAIQHHYGSLANVTDNDTKTSVYEHYAQLPFPEPQRTELQEDLQKIKEAANLYITTLEARRDRRDLAVLNTEELTEDYYLLFDKLTELLNEPLYRFIINNLVLMQKYPPSTLSRVSNR
ncbi:MAG: nucleotidyltransferase domain-containing protein [Nanoarchaeota archaeon]|nr:nucleotidyltransferase domain-containing protein [Nanoarchaeota archaeon]